MARRAGGADGLSGAVDVLVRPEDLRLTASASGSGIVATRPCPQLR